VIPCTFLYRAGFLKGAGAAVVGIKLLLSTLF
jgi:hypothetical protein